MEKKMKNKVSVIMPVYNCEKQVSNAIESVLNQTYKNTELIIVNDGSTDATEYICKKYEKNNKSIKYISKENEGPSKARNIALKSASGEYIMFIDADDQYLLNAVEIMVNSLQENDCDIVTANYNIIKDDKIIHERKCAKKAIYEKKDIFKYINVLQERNEFNISWNKIFRKKIIDENNVTFNNTLKIGEDFRFNLEYLRYISKAYVVEDNIYTYYINDNGLCSNNAKSIENRVIESMKYQIKYYEEEKYPIDDIQKRAIKNFFYINNVNYIIDNEEYLNILLNFKKKKNMIKILVYLIKNKKVKLLNGLLNAYNSILNLRKVKLKRR